jgi:hypothetical protein
MNGMCENRSPQLSAKRPHSVSRSQREDPDPAKGSTHEYPLPCPVLRDIQDDTIGNAQAEDISG